MAMSEKMGDDRLSRLEGQLKGRLEVLEEGACKGGVGVAEGGGSGGGGGGGGEEEEEGEERECAGSSRSARGC